MTAGGITMPPVKPSEKTGHEGEWWRKDRSDRERNGVDPNYESHADEAEINSNQFHESQNPVQKPT
jgi:hypothetical protein